jgi:type VI secretion system protein ImpH
MRNADTSLIEQLESDPHRFEFFQALRLLLAYQRRFSEQGDSAILEQSIRFRNSTSLGFPPSEIEALEFDWSRIDEDASQVPGSAESEPASPAKDAGQSSHAVEDTNSERSGRMGRGKFHSVVLTPAFLGLTGPSGVLPRHYTQHVADRVLYHRDMTTRAFLDIFTSRAVSLFYQSWMKYRPHLQYEADRKNRFIPLVLSLGGLGFSGTRDRLSDHGQGIADETLAYYVSAIRGRPRSAHWFARVVEDYFEVPAKTTEFVGQWMDIPAEERTSLGVGLAVLGDSAFCGSRVWDRQSRIRLTLGPMRKSRFEDMLPGSSGHRNLARLFRLMQGLACDCEVRLILDSRDVHGARLGSLVEPAQLGWASWMKGAKPTSDADDAAYLLSSDHGFD